MKSTVVYKTVGPCEIKGDFYPAAAPKSPVIICIHGGALISGSRSHTKPQQFNMYLEAGFSLFSIDYRLAPETKIDGIVEDVRDAILWLKHEGSKVFDIDVNKIAVLGNSAGGYLSLMTGTFLEKPNAIVSFYGYGDILADWYGKPDPFYCRQPAVTKEEAYSVVKGREVSEMEEQRFPFYLYCRQQGLWAQEVSGIDPSMHEQLLRKYCPQNNVTMDYPPTMLLHGTSDTDVPYEQSYLMFQELQKQGVASKLITFEGGGHDFDRDMENPAVISALEEVIDFLKTYLRR